MREEKQKKGFRGILGAAATGVASVALASAMFLPPAFAYEKNVTLTWNDGVSEPTPPNQISDDNGQTLVFQSQTSPVQAGSSQTVTQYFNQTIEADYSDLSGDVKTAVDGRLPRTIHIDNNGFVGDIPRYHFTCTSVNRIDERDVSIERDFPASQTPRDTIEDGGIRYSNPVRIDSYTKVVGGEEITYNRYRYTGKQQEQVVDHYHVVAYYGGDLTKVAEQGTWSKVVTYKSQDNAQPAPAQNPAGNPQQPANENRTDTAIINPTDPNANMPGNNNLFNGETITSGPYDNTAVTGSNTNSSSSDSQENAEDKSDESKGGLPLVPMAFGGAAIVLLAGGAAFLFLRKRGGDDPDDDAAEELIALASDELYPMPVENPETIARRSRPVNPGAIARLVEVHDVYDQREKAALGLVASRDVNAPTVLTMPDIGDTTFEPAPGADYYIMISDVSGFQSDRLIVASAASQSIYDGPLADQFKIDTRALADALNGLAPDGVTRKDLSGEIAYYVQVNSNLAAAQEQELQYDSAMGAYESQMPDDYAPYGLHAGNEPAGPEDLLSGLDDLYSPYAEVEPDALPSGHDGFDMMPEFDDVADDYQPSSPAMEAVEAIPMPAVQEPVEELVPEQSGEEPVANIEYVPAGPYDTLPASTTPAEFVASVLGESAAPEPAQEAVYYDFDDAADDDDDDLSFDIDELDFVDMSADPIASEVPEPAPVPAVSSDDMSDLDSLLDFGEAAPSAPVAEPVAASEFDFDFGDIDMGATEGIDAQASLDFGDIYGIDVPSPDEDDGDDDGELTEDDLMAFLPRI